MSDMKKENQIGSRDSLLSIEHILGYAVLSDGFQCNHCLFLLSSPFPTWKARNHNNEKPARSYYFFYYFCRFWFYIGCG